MTGPHWSHTARLALTTKSTYCTATSRNEFNSRNHVIQFQPVSIQNHDHCAWPDILQLAAKPAAGWRTMTKAVSCCAVICPFMHW